MACKKIKHLRHMGSICDYVKEFSSLILEALGMDEKDLLFKFKDNLQSWADQELRRRSVQDIATTMAVAESLVDFWRGDSSKTKPPFKGSRAKGGGDKGYKSHGATKEGSSVASTSKDGKGWDKRKEFKPKTSFSLCDGPHWACECPKRKALNAMIERETEQEGDSHTGSMQLLNALKDKQVKEQPQSKGLMYVEANVDGMTTKAMVDIGATHNFVLEEEASRLKFQTSKEASWLKAINSVSKPSQEVARGVTIRIKSWEGKVDFMVTPMDNFKVVLGMDFLS